jgi:hypothetical protein
MKLSHRIMFSIGLLLTLLTAGTIGYMGSTEKAYYTNFTTFLG